MTTRESQEDFRDRDVLSFCFFSLSDSTAYQRGHSRPVQKPALVPENRFLETEQVSTTQNAIAQYNLTEGTQHHTVVTLRVESF